MGKFMNLVISDLFNTCQIILAVMAALIITVDAITSFILFIKAYIVSENYNSILKELRLRLGYSIILGLEFIVASDIIESLIRPSYYELGRLALLVVIRTFLSYFLNKELQEI